MFCAETHLGPDGTRLKQNAQARLKSLCKHAGQLVYENVKKLRNRFEDMRWRKRRPRPLRTNQVGTSLLSAFGTRERRFFIQSQMPLLKYTCLSLLLKMTWFFCLLCSLYSVWSKVSSFLTFFLLSSNVNIITIITIIIIISLFCIESMQIPVLIATSQHLIIPQCSMSTYSFIATSVL